MSQAAYNPPPLEIWQANSLRMIVFPVESQVQTNQDWWQQLTGDEPDSSVRKKTERNDAGLYEDAHLMMAIDPFRIQWSANAAPVEPAQLLDEAPMLGTFSEKRGWFVEIMKRWLELSPPIKRIAFLATLFQKVENRAEGYRRLDQYLRHVEVHEESTDFFYRINRRISSRMPIDGLKINRISTWFVPKLSFELSARLGETTELAGREDEFYCAVDLDVNTNQDYSSELPQHGLPEILDELADLASDLAANGDVRES